MKTHWKSWFTKTKSESVPVTSTTVEPSASIAEETLCSTLTGIADAEILPVQENNIIEPESAPNNDIASMIAIRKCIQAKLLNTNKRDFTGNPRYENLDFVNEGDILTLGYIDETGTFLVLDARSNELGEIGSAIASTILESKENNIIAIIDKITENGQGIRSVSINVYI